MSVRATGGLYTTLKAFPQLRGPSAGNCALASSGWFQTQHLGSNWTIYLPETRAAAPGHCSANLEMNKKWRNNQFEVGFQL